MLNLPTISIVTPSLNQGKYLEQTIQSVLGQNYPNLEYIIIDGGSEDNSLEIIDKYKNHLMYWESGEDTGQANAINRGFSVASGEILGWLNSDDYYLPGTLEYIANHFKKRKVHSSQLYFGNCIHIVEGSEKTFGSNVTDNFKNCQLKLFDYIIQPSCFWTRSVLDEIGPLNENLCYAFDWEWFLRAEQAEVSFECTDRYLSVYRVHSKHKTHTGGQKRLREISVVYSRYASAEIAEAYLLYKTSKNISRLRSLISNPIANKIFSDERLIHKLHFKKIDWIEFNQLNKM